MTTEQPPSSTTPSKEPTKDSAIPAPRNGSAMPSGGPSPAPEGAPGSTREGAPSSAPEGAPGSARESAPSSAPEGAPGSARESAPGRNRESVSASPKSVSASPKGGEGEPAKPRPASPTLAQASPTAGEATRRRFLFLRRRKAPAHGLKKGSPAESAGPPAEASGAAAASTAGPPAATTAAAGTTGAAAASTGPAAATSAAAGTTGAAAASTGPAAATSSAAQPTAAKTGATGTGDKPPPTTDPQKTVKAREPLPTERPPGAPADPWTAFATAPERKPGRIRRALRKLGRGLIHEYALVTYFSLLAAVALTWPTLRYPLHTLPQDVWDPARQAWQISWAGHILLTDPVRLWQSNAFFPEPNSFAFGDSLLGYAPFGMLGEGPLAATLRYNILFVLAHALLLIGGYALVRQLGAGRTASTVAAAAIAYAPWRLAQEGHLDIVSAGGIPLALALLARGHGRSLRRGLRPARRHAGWAAAGWLVAAWQVTLGFSLGLPFLYVLGLIVLFLFVAVPFRRWRRPAQRPVLGWRLLATDTLGALIVAGIAALIAVPYFKAPAGADATTEIRFFSPPLRSLLIGPAESRIWGAPHEVPRSSLGWPAEMSLLPGFVLYALALAGLAFSIWTLRQRLFLLAALAVSIILSLGTNFFEGRWSYLPLFGHLPAAFGVRIPGRLMLWTTLLLAVLAAGAVAEFVRRAEHLAETRNPPWPSPWLRVATFVPLALVVAEGWNATAHPVVPDQPAAMRTVTGPMLVLPTTPLSDQLVMLWSTTRFQTVANGSGGFAAQRQADLRRNVTTFPDAASIQYLRSQGINTVLLLRSETPGTPWERAGDIPVEALGIQREDLDDAVVFRLSPQDPATAGNPTTPTSPGLPGQTVPGQPGATVPGLPGATVPGLPGATVPGLPGATVPGLPGATVPGLPGATVPGQPGATIPGLPGATLPAAVPYPATDPLLAGAGLPAGFTGIVGIPTPIS